MHVAWMDERTWCFFVWSSALKDTRTSHFGGSLLSGSVIKVYILKKNEKKNKNKKLRCMSIVDRLNSTRRLTLRSWSRQFYKCLGMGQRCQNCNCLLKSFLGKGYGDIHVRTVKGVWESCVCTIIPIETGFILRALTVLPGMLFVIMVM